MLSRDRFKTLVFLLAYVPLTSSQAADPVPSQVDFNRDVRPILADACYACHGPDSEQRKADLRLDTAEGLEAARRTGILTDKPQASELFRRITADDEDVRMPPGSAKQLSGHQIAVIKRWLEQGGTSQQHWAYRPLKRPPLPRSAGSQTPIDQFVQGQLEQVGLTPAPPADARTLIRRLSFDLLGLPPTAAEVEAFVHQSTSLESAYSQLVDRLLASPHFGERLGLYWLDLVRYADSVGYHKDSHREVWLYRDYVIDAMNDNMPFDQFVTEQLAGDLLVGSQFEQYRWRVASGFNRMNQTTSEGGAQAKQYLAIYAADRVRNTAAILLGSTMGCAECHDHKYDPFTTQDFYSFAAFFADLQERGVAFPKQVALPTRQQVVELKRLKSEVARLQNVLLTADNVASTQSIDTSELARRIESLKQQTAKVVDPASWPKTLISEPGKPRTTRILPRGNWLDDSGPIVQPAIPAFLGALAKLDGRATRLDLARWIVDRDNPLTARVFVNRIWRLFFGQGLSRTVDDVGSQGEAPTHPELLDWLAIEFVDSGWDIKHLVRSIVTSQTYRRSSIASDDLIDRDPENAYFARQSSFRLDAEFVRDNALAVAGLLSPELGGRSVKPYQPANYWYRLYIQGEYNQDQGDDLYRRGLYTYWRRSFWNPSLQAFDAPSREECVADRPRSNTPQQSLVLLNDPTYVEAARALAERIIREGGSQTSERIEWVYRSTLARPPSEQESVVLNGLYLTHLDRYREDKTAAEKLLSVGEYTVAEDIAQAELAAWTSVARAILNLHEMITRS